MYTLGLGSFLGDFADRYTPGEVQYGTSEEVNQCQKTENLAVKLLTDILVSRAVNGLISKQFKMNKAGNTNREVATVENASKGPEYMRKDSIFINDGTPGGTVKFESQVVGNSNYELSKITNTYNGNTVVKATNKVTGEIHSFKNFGNTQAGNSLSITNTNTSLVPFNPNVSTGVTVTTSSSVRTAAGSVVPNLITSGKSVTTLEAPKNPVVKPFIKPKQDIETVKQPAVTSEKPKTVERSHSQGSNNHNSNKESFNQKTEKILIEILLAKIMAQKKLQIKCHHFQIRKIFIEIVIPKTMTTRFKIIALQMAQATETVVLRKILSLLWRIVARFIH